MDIDFTCRDPTMTIPWHPAADDISKWWYPVELNRISATVIKKSPYIIENKWFITPVKENTTPHRYASSFYNTAADREVQKMLTGSDKPWSDIILLNVLSITKVGQGRVKDVVKDWSIKSLAEQKFTLLNFEPATITVMHELIHSIAMGLGNEIGV
jgi:hypothetical protein